MLQAVPILGSCSSASSSGLVASLSQRLKLKKKKKAILLHPSCACGFSLISRTSIAPKTISLSSRKSTSPFLLPAHKYNQKGYFCNFRVSGMSLAHNESPPDGPSSSSPSSVTIHSSTVRFPFVFFSFVFFFLAFNLHCRVLVFLDVWQHQFYWILWSFLAVLSVCALLNATFSSDDWSSCHVFVLGGHCLIICRSCYLRTLSSNWIFFAY